VQIDESTLTVLDVKDGAYTFEAAEAGTWVFFTYWAVPSNQTSGDTVPTAYVINHFGLSGTEAMLNFWEDSLLTPAIEEHFAKYGGAMFEDSLELNSAELPWCDGMAEYFQENYGYSLLQVLPLLGGQLTGTSGVSMTAETDIGEGENTIPAGTSYTYKTAIVPMDAAEQANIVDDYATNLSDMYIENHIIPIQQWCAEHNIQYRAQAQGTSDNNWVDSIEAAAYLAIAEGETLGMNKSPDGFRSLAGAANISDVGTGIVSVEIGAEFGALYQVSVQRLTELVNRCAAVGVNQYILHGFATRSQFCSNTKWPGWMPFDEPLFSETWNNTNPSWDYMTVLTDYVSRVQTVLQYGDARVDFAVYRDDLGIRTDEGNTKGVLYLDDSNVPADNAATAVGYSYNYVSPGNFKLSTAVVENGVLNPDGAAYKALVINNETDMELADAQQILAYAEAGLPMVLIGATPAADGTHGASDDAAVAAVFETLKAMETVAVIENEDNLPAALNALGVEPSASYDSCNLVSQHRADENADLYYLFNQTSFYDYASNNVYHDDAATIDTVVTLAGKGQPYAMDLYDGSIVQIAEYTDNGNGTISVPVSIDDGEAMVIGITDDLTYFGDFRAVQATNNAGFGEVIVEGDAIELRSTEEGNYDVTVNGMNYTGTVAAAAAAQTLTQWDLTVTSFQPGANAKLANTDENYDPTQVDKVVLDTIHLDGLKSWQEIEGLQTISGRGQYDTTFTVTGNVDGAMLDLGETYDAILAVYINGQLAPVADQFNRVIDLGDAVVEGENTLSIITGTTLAQAVRAAGGNCSSNDSFSAYPSVYGITGDVIVTPYVVTEVGLAMDATVELTGPAAITVEDTATYTVTAANVKNLATATVTMELPADCLTEPVVTVPDGSYVIFEEVVDGVLTVVIGNNTGITSEAPTELLSVTLAATGDVGSQAVTLTEAVLSAYLTESESFLHVVYGNTMVETAVDYSTYDVNQDGTVNQLDITRAQRFYGQANELADVNTDGEVNIDDLILILNNYS